MQKGRSILVVEDEADLAEIICFNLEREGYASQRTALGDEALREARSQRPDLILLDRMLPGISGDEVAAQIKRDPATSSIPIIMLSAKVEESDQLVGLALGADDYVPKPCSMKLLLARVAAMLRRGEKAASESTQLTIGPYRLDVERHEVRVADRPVVLTATEFRLLQALMMVRGRVLARAQLIERAMGPGVIVTDRTIDVHVTALRRKISAADPSGEAARWLQTIRGVGYAFREPAGD